MGSSNQQHTYKMGNSLLESREAKRDLGVIIASKTNMGRHCEVTAGRANRTLSCIHRCISSRARGVIPPLYVALVRPQLDYWVRFWAPHFGRDVGSMEKVQRRPLAWSGDSRAGPTRRGDGT